MLTQILDYRREKFIFILYHRKYNGVWFTQTFFSHTDRERKGDFMADRDENRFDRPEQEPNHTPYGQQPPDDNGCTYHSGRIQDWNHEDSAQQNNSTGPYGPYQQPDSRQQSGYGRNSSPPNYGMNQNGEYRYSYEDYNRISHTPSGPEIPRRRVGSGIKVFAVIVTVLLIVTIAILMGFILHNGDTAGTGELSSQTVSQDYTPPESSLPESSAESREEIEVPELNITSHAVEDTYISSDGKLTTAQVFEKVRPSVVGILNYAAENPLTAASSGSGIILSKDGYILTNAHVIDGAANLVVVLDNNEEYAAKLIGSDTSTDLAVIKIDAENLTASELGDSGQLQVGEKVIAIGNPAGLNLAGSTTQGIVSGLDRTISVTLDSGESISMDVIQTDAAINPGNSGGPLINEYGQVIGINSSRLSSSSFDGIGFAIPINNALPIVEDLIQYGYVTGRVKLGITYYPISEVVGAMSGYTPGLLVYSVDPTMDIYAKGVRAGDIITEMDGQLITSTEEIKKLLESKKPGDTLELTFYRGSSSTSGASYTISVILSEDTGNTDTSTYSTESGSAQIPTPGSNT